MLKALFIDLDGVIRIWPRSIVDEAEKAAGLPQGTIFQATFRPELVTQAITGQISDEVWRQQVIVDLAAKYPSGDAALAVKLWSKSSGEVDQAMLALVQRVRQTVPVTLITNATTRLPYDLDQLGLSDAFNHMINSSSIGFAKPSPEIYQAALELNGIRPEEALFVDDRKENVEGAVQVGLHGHFFTGLEQFQATLQTHQLL